MSVCVSVCVVSVRVRVSVCFLSLQLHTPAAALAPRCGCAWVGGVFPPCSGCTTDSRDEKCRLPPGSDPGGLQENRVAGAT